MHLKRKKVCIMKHIFFELINLTNKDLPPWFHWTQNNPCSWLPKDSMKKET